MLDGLERKRRAESEAYAKHRLQPKLTLWFLFWNVPQAPSSARSALEGASNTTSLRAAQAKGLNRHKKIEKSLLTNCGYKCRIQLYR